MNKLKISTLFSILFLLLNWNSWGQKNNCPAFPASSKWDTNCYIPANLPDPDAVSYTHLTLPTTPYV